MGRDSRSVHWIPKKENRNSQSNRNREHSLKTCTPQNKENSAVLNSISIISPEVTLSDEEAFFIQKTINKVTVGCSHGSG